MTARLVAACVVCAALGLPTAFAADAPATSPASVAKAPTLAEQLKNLQSKDGAVRDQATESLVRHAAASGENKSDLLEKLATVDGAIGQFRASYVSARIRDKVRIAPGEGGEVALQAAARFVDDHLDDAPIKKFSPEVGFTHMAVVPEGEQWNVIMERAGSAPETGQGPMRGITLTYDPQAKRIVKVTNWQPKEEHAVEEAAR